MRTSLQKGRRHKTLRRFLTKEKRMTLLAMTCSPHSGDCTSSEFLYYFCCLTVLLSSVERLLTCNLHSPRSSKSRNYTKNRQRTYTCTSWVAVCVYAKNLPACHRCNCLVFGVWVALFLLVLRFASEGLGRRSLTISGLLAVLQGTEGTAKKRNLSTFKTVYNFLELAQ